MPVVVMNDRPGQRSDLAQQDARGLVEALDPAEFAQRGAPEQRRRRRAHRLRRRQRGRRTHRCERADQRRAHADGPGDHEGLRARAEQQERKVIEIGVEPRVVQAEPVAEEPAEQHADGADAERQARVVPGDVAVGVAKSLQQADLAALDRDQPAEHHVREERRHGQEDGGQDRGQRAVLVDLAHQEPVRQLVCTRVGADAAVAREDAIHALDDRVRIRAAQQREAHVVERAVEVEGGLQRLVSHPQHAETPVVRHQRARPDGVHVLRRQGDADDRADRATGR